MAQPPLAIPYQAVARDTTGTLLSNRPVSLRFTIRDSILAGTVLYCETQSLTTNVLATFTANIGTGTVVTGSFASIKWGINSKFLEVEIDPTGGSTYLNMGTQQLFSVPYALYSGTSGSVISSGGGSSPNTLLYTTNGF